MAYCELCLNCIHDCKRYKNIKQCDNFQKALPLSFYKEEIKKQNINLHKLCRKYKLKYSIMMAMLKGNRPLTYKYRMALEERIFEKEEYLPYLEGDVID